MSKTRIFALLLFGIMVAAILTNPKKDAIEQRVSNKAESLLADQLHYKDKQALELSMVLFGDQILREFIEKNAIYAKIDV